MILMYHKVDIIAPSRWWVTTSAFKEQMNWLERFQCVYLDQYEPGNCSQVVITFDDAYENVYRHAFPVLKKKALPFELFVIGDVLGDWNDFDASESKTRLCARSHLQEMAEAGARIQWHTRSHSRLTKLDEREIIYELDVSKELRSAFQPPHFRWFSYPYGAHDDRVVAHVRSRFSGAVSVDCGSAMDMYRLNRVTVDQGWRLDDARTTDCRHDRDSSKALVHGRVGGRLG